ncbi:hypothetical protein COO91_10861 (plasmid) [Nostoc flagelliforme CCNUN1]|uniref:Uncharacterized protein n=1 Tax=Nostoc flagelliforme CCNUN1 TaxID=2038116 RepID=A0A2K8TAK6_9NOSO|nr:hypothetical protein [Nostoc flagelliforme]AUB44623.1 hypothetical protein COO91_10861 [Nostoc flagelliforme CCNUN1]
MYSNQSSNSLQETVSNINRDSGISNNMMAYRLALFLEKHPPSLQSTTTLDASERENLQSELRTTLSQNLQNIENYRQNLKQKYYTEYLDKFAVTQQSSVTSQPDNSRRVENLIAQKKNTFLLQVFESGVQKLPLGQRVSKESREQRTGSEAQNNINQLRENNVSPGIDIAEESLIKAVMRTVMTMGKDTEQGRIYEGIAYRLQLFIKEGMQLLSVHRKTGNPKTAFTAYKDDSNEFKITQNNLSHTETNRLIAFDKQQTAQQPTSQSNHIDKDNSTELGD